MAMGEEPGESATTAPARKKRRKKKRKREPAAPTSDQLLVEWGPYAARMLRQGTRPEQLESELVASGLTHTEAIDAIGFGTDVLAARSARASRDRTHGALWALGGLAVTLLTYSAAQGGGHYVVAYGAIAYGAVRFFRGLSG